MNTLPYREAPTPSISRTLVKEKARANDVESTISQKNLEVKLNLLKYGAEFFICGAMKSAPK